MNRYCEKALFQRSETARGAKPHGGCAQGSPQSTGSGGASAAGFASWQRREMAHRQGPVAIKDSRGKCHGRW